jgi:surfeit locus 1 family protein
VSGAGDTVRAGRSTATLLWLGGLAALGVVLLLALGIWQLDRLAWKLHLIDQVDARIHAAPIVPPGPADWPHIGADADEYLHVAASGQYLNNREALVEAVTERGGGFWVMTPFRTDQGFTVLINRGFVPTAKRDPQALAVGEIEGDTEVTGLVRMSEPGGGFLRANDPDAGRWFSRDVNAIAAAQKLTDVAPYFIDADDTPNRGGLPIGGLTVTSFPNNHLVYALTWFALALMLAGATIFVGKEEWRTRRRRLAGLESASTVLRPEA